MCYVNKGTRQKEKGYAKQSPSTKSSFAPARRKQEDTPKNQQLDPHPNLYTSFLPESLSQMLKDCISYRIPSVQKKSTVSCPLCRRAFFNDDALNKHILQRHTKREIENFLDIEEERRNDPNEIKVQWIGRYISCPPFTSTIPLDICYHHIPPHPKCLKCAESIERFPMFPPIRFYKSVYFEHNLSSTTNLEGKSSSYHSSSDKASKHRQFHFNLKDKECCVELENGSFAKIEALCEDNFKRNFIGLKHFVTHDTFKGIVEAKGLSFSSYCEDNGIKLNKSDELILDSEVHWMEMTKVNSRVYIFFCDEDEFLQRKLNMGVSIDSPNKKPTSILKFCQLEWLGDGLKSLLF